MPALEDNCGGGSKTILTVKDNAGCGTTVVVEDSGGGQSKDGRC
jgi:hypothetical protein